MTVIKTIIFLGLVLLFSTLFTSVANAACINPISKANGEQYWQHIAFTKKNCPTTNGDSGWIIKTPLSTKPAPPEPLAEKPDFDNATGLKNVAGGAGVGILVGCGTGAAIAAIPTFGFGAPVGCLVGTALGFTAGTIASGVDYGVNRIDKIESDKYIIQSPLGWLLYLKQAIDVILKET